MLLHSLHSKIFFLITATLIIVALVVMMASQRNVTRTIMTSEHRAIHNVLQLIEHDAASRWSAMLTHKVSTVLHGRHELKQTSKVIEATLNAYANLAKRGIITSTMAQRLARQWINQLELGDDRYAFAFNSRHIVVASENPDLRGFDLSAIRDYKNRPLAQTALEESRSAGGSFAIYRRPTAPHSTQNATTTLDWQRAHDQHARYAYFSYFHPWDWVFAVSDSAATIVDRLHEYRTQMEQSVRETLQPMQLMRTGFVSILDNTQRFIVPPPPGYADQFNAVSDNGQTLQERLASPPHQPRSTQHIISADDRWLVESTYYAPLDWTIIAAVPDQDLSAPARQLLLNQAWIFVAMLTLSLLCAWFLAARIIRPLRTLTAFAHKLPHYALQDSPPVPQHIAVLPATHNDEVGRLAQAFLYMDRKLRENITRLMQEAAARERLASELGIARAIQQGLLPAPLSPDRQPHIDLYAVMRPAKAVGGDLYDHFTLPDGKYCVVVGDVSDKGIPAALFMAVTCTLIRSIAEDETSPSRIVRKLNDRLAENNPNLMFVTLLLAVFDVGTGALSWVNAGHLPPLIVDKHGTVRLLRDRSGPACGVQAHVAYHTHHTRLQQGESLVGYTDGITESSNRHNEQYGDDRLVASLAHPATSAAALGVHLIDNVDQFTADAEQADDITLLIIRRP